MGLSGLMMMVLGFFLLLAIWGAFGFGFVFLGCFVLSFFFCCCCCVSVKVYPTLSLVLFLFFTCLFSSFFLRLSSGDRSFCDSSRFLVLPSVELGGWADDEMAVVDER